MRPIRLLLLAAALAALAPAAAQLYQPGESLRYRISYRAKLFPNTEVGEVRLATTRTTDDQGAVRYQVTGSGRTLAAYRLFFSIDDVYRVLIDTATLRPLRFSSDLHEGDYTFWSRYAYDWEARRVATRWQSRQRPVQEASLPLTDESLDAISLFFRMRSAEVSDFREGEPRALQMVLEDTVRTIRFRYLGREKKKVRSLGYFDTLKFECQLGTTEGFSFTDGTLFTMWISDDRNKIPLYMESPIRVGSINVYLVDFEGLRHPLARTRK